MVLDRINQANDIKYLNEAQLEELPGEIRQFLIEHISKTGGHLASNLGVVELTMALHLVLNFPEDKLIWDVGHQSYTHKILTGRKREFEHLRQLDGISGFPKRSESDCDAFDTGHSSTSISAGLGYARARDLLGEDYHVVSVIGDGALTGGPAFEALNNAAELQTNMIIVLNDNKMSISENVGGLSQHLASLRTAEAYQKFKSGVHNSLERLPYGERVVRRIRKTKSSLKHSAAAWPESPGPSFPESPAPAAHPSETASPAASTSQSPCISGPRSGCCRPGRTGHSCSYTGWL